MLAFNKIKDQVFEDLPNFRALYRIRSMIFQALYK